MKRRVFALVLAVIMALGIVPTAAVAYTTSDFSDVPSNHWAYEAVMKMADAGVIKGTGNGQFSPDMKLSAEMFVVLVGRVVFPEVKADGTDWSSPYIAEAKAKGLLTGTNVTDANIKGDISRYDMAVILAKCVEILKVSASKADSSKVTDYGEVPAKYIDAVLMAYGSGLIRGDQSGSFNGQNSMTRQEAATVMDRLLGLKGGSAQGGTTEPEKSPEPTQPTTSPKEDTSYAWAAEYFTPLPTYDPDKVSLVEGKKLRLDRSFLPSGLVINDCVYLHVGDTFQLKLCEVPSGYRYAEGNLNEQVQYWLDRVGNPKRFENFKIWSSDYEPVATVDENGLVTAVGPGYAHIQVSVPVIYYGETWIKSSDTLTVYVDP